MSKDLYAEVETVFFLFFFRTEDLARKIIQITRIDELPGRSERSEFQFRSSNSVYQLYLFLEWIQHIIVSELQQIKIQFLPIWFRRKIMFTIILSSTRDQFFRIIVNSQYYRPNFLQNIIQIFK